jgi:hypothetical protein
MIQNIPDVGTYPLKYVFENTQLKKKENTLWLEFGAGNAITINYISSFTNDLVYGFDSFHGLPEKWRDGFEVGCFSTGGVLPPVNPNVTLVPGLFQDTLINFLQEQNKKISFIHIDCDLYSSTKFVLDSVKDYLDEGCIIIFDELVNYPGFDGDNGELRALHEFVTENNVEYEWIGMNGPPMFQSAYENQNVAMVVRKVHPPWEWN